MSMKRRDFVKAAAIGATACGVACATPKPAEARGNRQLPPKAVGFLFDSTLCVGCKNCVVACKEANGLPVTVPIREAYRDPSVDLSGEAQLVIKKYVGGKAMVKDQVENGFAFIKKSCMHCVDPSCVSVCPVSAMTKDPETGIVAYDKDKCLGCRYCVVSCPFGVPRFEYNTAFPKVVKCQFCRHLQAEGKIPACAESCPTGATLFGSATALKAEAKRRLALEPGTEVRHDRRILGSGEPTRPRLSAKYVNQLYGEKELGGTQMVMLSGVPFENVGMPKLPERSYAADSETVQHTLYEGLIAPAVALAGLVTIVHRNKKKQHEEEEH